MSVCPFVRLCYWKVLLVKINLTWISDSMSSCPSTHKSVCPYVRSSEKFRIKHDLLSSLFKKRWLFLVKFFHVNVHELYDLTGRSLHDFMIPFSFFLTLGFMHFCLASSLLRKGNFNYYQVTYNWWKSL